MPGAIDCSRNTATLATIRAVVTGGMVFAHVRTARTPRYMGMCNVPVKWGPGSVVRVTATRRSPRTPADAARGTITLEFRALARLPHMQAPAAPTRVIRHPVALIDDFLPDATWRALLDRVLASEAQFEPSATHD